MLDFILSQGADVNALDTQGKKPIDYASTDDIKELLTQANDTFKNLFNKYKAYTDITMLNNILSKENINASVTNKIVEKITDYRSEQLFDKYKNIDLDILPYVLSEERNMNDYIIEKVTQKN